MKTEADSIEHTMALGERIGSLLQGGEVIELLGDVGAGKTTLVKGIAKGMGSTDDIQSPTFIISAVHSAAGGLTLAHYDFYRLHDAGIMAEELAETIHDQTVVTIIEWGEIIAGVLPKDTVKITITAPTEHTRQFELAASGAKSNRILEGLA